MQEVTYDTFVPKTLMERAKPELLKAIAQYKVDYPYSALMVEEELKKKCGVSHLPYGVVLEIGRIARSANMEFDLDSPWSLFRNA